MGVPPGYLLSPETGKNSSDLISPNWQTLSSAQQPKNGKKNWPADQLANYPVMVSYFLG
jgi:hypothetical protein